MKGYANSRLLITPRELAALIEGPADRRPLVLDLRPPEPYSAGHVPGAIHLNLWGLSLTDTDPAPFKAFMWMIEHVLAVHGVTAATPVVVYDEQSGMRAARAFWFLEYFGHPSVRCSTAASAPGRATQLPVTRDAAPPPPERVDRRAATEHARHLARRARRASQRGCRDPRYAQRRRVLRHDRPREARRRIPGAVHIEWTRNLTPDGRLQAGRGARRRCTGAPA